MIRSLAQQFKLMKGLLTWCCCRTRADHFDSHRGHLIVDDTTKVDRASESSPRSGTKSALTKLLMVKNNTNDLQRRLGTFV